jgi:hypothetical protein
LEAHPTGDSTGEKTSSTRRRIVPAIVPENSRLRQGGAHNRCYAESSSTRRRTGDGQTQQTCTLSQSWQQTKALSALQKASESVKRKQKVVFVFAASSGAARYVMAPGNKLHDSSSQRRTRIITFNKELYVCLRVFMGFPGVLPRHSRWDHQSETHMPCTSTLTAHYARP